MQAAPRAKRRKWDDTGSGSPAAATAPPAAGGGGFTVPAEYAVRPAGQGAHHTAAASGPQFQPAGGNGGPIAGIPINADVIARAQQGAAAAMEKINRVHCPVQRACSICQSDFNQSAAHSYSSAVVLRVVAMRVVAMCIMLRRSVQQRERHSSWESRCRLGSTLRCRI